jgi:flagellar biogenesis protein FliO
VLGRTLENFLVAKVDEAVLVLGVSAQSIRQQITDSPIKHLERIAKAKKLKLAVTAGAEAKSDARMVL